MLATRPNKTAKTPAEPPTSASPRSAAWSHPPWLRHRPEPSRRGTTFRIFHPTAEGALGETPDPATAAVLHGNGELRLLVVAEVNIRNVTTTTLSHSGYRVIAPATGGGSNPP